MRGARARERGQPAPAAQGRREDPLDQLRHRVLALRRDGTLALAWTVIGTLPVVQCVEVKRTGNFLTGIHLKLLSLSAPIDNEDDCP